MKTKIVTTSWGQEIKVPVYVDLVEVPNPHVVLAKRIKKLEEGVERWQWDHEEFHLRDEREIRELQAQIDELFRKVEQIKDYS